MKDMKKMQEDMKKMQENMKNTQQRYGGDMQSDMQDYVGRLWSRRRTFIPWIGRGARRRALRKRLRP